MYLNTDYKKIYVEQINALSYNKKNLIKILSSYEKNYLDLEIKEKEKILWELSLVLFNSSSPPIHTLVLFG